MFNNPREAKENRDQSIRIERSPKEQESLWAWIKTSFPEAKSQSKYVSNHLMKIIANIWKNKISSPIKSLFLYRHTKADLVQMTMDLEL